MAFERVERLLMSMSWRALVQGVVLVVGGAVAVSAEEAAGADVGGSSFEDVARVVGKALAPCRVVGLLEPEGAVDEQAEGFVVFVGAFEVAPFVEGFAQEGVAVVGENAVDYKRPIGGSEVVHCAYI